MRAPAASGPAWPTAGQGTGDDHDQPDESTLSPANVNNMVTKWELTTAGNVSATPTVADGMVYFPDWGGKLWAVNAATGVVAWSDSVPSLTGIGGGALSRTSPAVSGNELIVGERWTEYRHDTGAHVFAVSRTTGKLLWQDKVDSDPASLITASPVIYDGVAYVGISSNEETLASKSWYTCCTFRGAVVALNVKTGKMLWKTYMVPSNNGGSDSNKPGYYTGASVWGSSPALDPAAGMLFVGTGDNHSNPPGVCARPKQTGCTAPAADDDFDSIVGLKMSTGKIAWADHTQNGDTYIVGCRHCGPDYDFSAGPNLFTTTDPATGQPEQLLGIGGKSGVYWAVNPATGAVVWHTQVGPGGGGGGILWGTATDGTGIFCAEVDSLHTPYTVGGSGPQAGEQIDRGSWAELDAATGQIVWQTPDPDNVGDGGYVSLANGVVYAGDDSPSGANMFALDAGTGAVLSSFASGGEVTAGAAIVDGTVYWGSGYSAGPNDKFYAFGLPSSTRRAGPGWRGPGLGAAAGLSTAGFGLTEPSQVWLRAVEPRAVGLSGTG